VFSLARRSMGRRCWKKAVMCGASGVHALAGTSVPLSFAHICAAPLWDPLVAGRLPSERISCWLSRVFLEFPFEPSRVTARGGFCEIWCSELSDHLA